MTRPDVNQFGTASKKAETKSTRRQVPAGDETTSDTLTSVFKRKFGFPLVFPSRWLIWQTTSWCEVLLKLSEVFLFNCFIRRLFFMICQFVADNSNLLIDCEFCRFQFSADFSKPGSLSHLQTQDKKSLQCLQYLNGGPCKSHQITMSSL